MREIFIDLLYLLGCSIIGVVLLLATYTMALTLEEIYKSFKRK